MLDKLLRLTFKKSILIVVAWALCVVLHNVVYALFRDDFGPQGDEPFFLLLAVVVIPLYLVATVVYTIVSLIIRQRGS